MLTSFSSSPPPHSPSAHPRPWSPAAGGGAQPHPILFPSVIGDMDGGAWNEAAARNPILAAAEIYFMARPAERVPWRHLLPQASTTTSSSSSSHPPPPLDKWGGRGRRGRRARKGILEEKVEAEWGGRASPATPLSWSASSSGSGSDAEEARCGYSVPATGTRGVGSAGPEGGDGDNDNGGVESNRQSQVVKELSMVSVVDEVQPAEPQYLPFDLNLPCPEDLDAGPCEFVWRKE